MIKFDKVVKRFDGVAVLDELSVEIAEGEIFAVVGPSGTGKSVLLRHAVGLLSPDSGSVTVAGVEVSSALDAELNQVRATCGYLFQGAALLGWMNVADNVALPLRETTRLSEREIAAKVSETLESVGLAAAAEKFPNEISGGMQKRAGLARALVTGPSVILYDEPTSGLDPVTSASIDRLIVSLRDRLHVTSVVVTHDLRGALSSADHIGLLCNGKFVEVSTPAEFVRSSHPEVLAFLDAQHIAH